MRSSGRSILFAVALASAACERAGHDIENGEALAARVEAELRTQDMDGVSVAVDRRVAVLTGLVPSESARILAEKTASSVTGVLAVDNRIVVAQPPALTGASDDARAAAAIHSRLASRGLHALAVTVADGTVVVSGPLSPAEHADAMRVVAESASGRRIVDRTHEP